MMCAICFISKVKRRRSNAVKSSPVHVVYAISLLFSVFSFRQKSVLFKQTYLHYSLPFALSNNNFSNIESDKRMWCFVSIREAVLKSLSIGALDGNESDFEVATML